MVGKRQGKRDKKKVEKKGGKAEILPSKKQVPLGESKNRKL